MCGILGVHLKCDLERDMGVVLDEIMRDLSIRGKHAFGTCYYSHDKNQFVCNKSFKYEWITLMHDLFNEDERRFIFHTRYSTSGNWKDMNNNQPIVVGNMAIAMNGVISMATKEEYEKQYEVKCSTENDTEIILRKMEQGQSAIEFLSSNPKASFAAVMLDKNHVYTLRNNSRPLYKYEDDDMSLFVSTIDTIKRAGLDISKASIVPQNELVVL